jgi:hypothetical protein
MNELPPIATKRRGQRAKIDECMWPEFIKDYNKMTWEQLRRKYECSIGTISNTLKLIKSKNPDLAVGEIGSVNAGGGAASLAITDCSTTPDQGGGKPANP